MKRIDHPFIAVAGHEDDDECTHREDGTDATYCGQQAYHHEMGDNVCDFCRETRDDLSTGSDGITTACADCHAEAEVTA